jgi:TusE/DsrC/DsvC family sulfur relay protein
MTACTPTTTPLERDAQGYLANADEWTEQVARQIARENGIKELTPRHWQVITSMRTAYVDRGSQPWLRTIARVSGVPIRELYRLFPRGPSRLVAKIGGMPKRRVCI